MLLGACNIVKLLKWFSNTVQTGLSISRIVDRGPVIRQTGTDFKKSRVEIDLDKIGQNELY